MQKSATINMRVGILLASVAVFCVPLSVSAIDKGFIGTYIPFSYDFSEVGGTFQMEAGIFNGDSVSDKYWQVQMYVDDYNITECSAVVGPVSAETDSSDTFVFDRSDQLAISEIDVYISDSATVDGNGCFSTGEPVAYWYSETSNIAVFSDGTTGTSTSDSTAEEVAAATGVAALGFATFIGGFTSTLWMWRRFLG